MSSGKADRYIIALNLYIICHHADKGRGERRDGTLLPLATACPEVHSGFTLSRVNLDSTKTDNVMFLCD